MQNASVAKIIALLGREQFTQGKLNLVGVFCFDKTEEIAYANKVSVGNNRRFAVNIAANQICGFSAYAGQGG